MLTNDEIERVARLVRLAPYMDQEMRGKLLELIHDLKAADSAGIMPQSAIQQMVDVIDDKTLRVIVEEQKHGRSEPGFMKASPARKPEEKRSGPPKEIALGPPSGVEHCDRIADHFAALDRRDLEKRLRGDG